MFNFGSIVRPIIGIDEKLEEAPFTLAEIWMKY